jgi:hypothetical protein
VLYVGIVQVYDYEYMHMSGLSLHKCLDDFQLELGVLRWLGLSQELLGTAMGWLLSG